MKYLIALLLLTTVVGCGGTSMTAKTPPTQTTNPPSPPPPPPPPEPTSTWAGTYTGNLNFKGCPSTIPCGGDAITIKIAEAENPSIPEEFVPDLTITGTDTTTGDTFTGTGTALYDGAAPVGPGTEDTTATATITLGDSLFLLGTGSSITSAPVDIQTIAVNNSIAVGGSTVKGPLYFGTLTRQP